MPLNATPFRLKYRYPLHLQIATLFTLLIVFIGSVIVIFSDSQMTRLTEINTNQQYQKTGVAVAAELDDVTRAMRMSVSQAAIVNASNETIASFPSSDGGGNGLNSRERSPVLNALLGLPAEKDGTSRLFKAGAQRWAEVNSLHKNGRGVREISRITGLSRVTVRRWIQSVSFPEMSTRPPKPSLLDSWRNWLEQQRENGNHNASQIWREMVSMGFTGSETTVRDAIAKWRKGVTETVLASVRLPSASRVSRWLMPWRIIRGEENYASRFIGLMCEKEPQLKMAQQLALDF